jgi:hypothetical protein
LAEVSPGVVARKAGGSASLAGEAEAEAEAGAEDADADTGTTARELVCARAGSASASVYETEPSGATAYLPVAAAETVWPGRWRNREGWRFLREK